MTAIKNVRLASLASIVGVSLIVLAFAPVAFAADYSEDGGGGWDSGSYDLSGWDSGSYDLSGYDSGSYDLSGYDSGSYDLSGYDSGSYDLSSGGYDVYDVYGVQDVYGTETVQENGVGYSYNDYSTGYSSGGYSMPSYTPSYSQPFSFRAPSTSYYAPSYPAPAPQRPVQQQQQQQQQQQGGGQPINIVNTNTNNNNNVNNNVNTVSVVTPVSQTPVTYPVQYVYPQQPVYPTYPTYPTYNYPTYNNTYCTITSTQGAIANGQPAYLTWSSSGATSAWLSDGIGVVAVNGSLAVRPNNSKTYTLTVSGYGGTNTCSTYVTVNGSYISLSQIPYTGFDFGPVGNAIYWLSLLSFAVAGAYLVVYYKGGALALVGSMIGSRQMAMHEKTPVQSPTIETKVEVVETPVETMTPSPIEGLANLPAISLSDRPAHLADALRVAPMAKATMDAMVVMHSKEGNAPRIVITRS